MNNYQSNNDDEIDLRTLFLMLWYGKIYIFFFSFLFTFFASMYLQNAKRLYLVEYKLKPVSETQIKNSFSGLGGIASLAGIQLPSNTTTDFKIFQVLISSVEVSEIVFKNKKLVKEIFEDEWNSSLNSFSDPPKSKFRDYINYLKGTITGSNGVHYISPNPRRLAIYVSKSIFIDEDKETGFLTLSAVSPKPDISLLLISELIEASDQIMRQRYINFSKEPLAFYKEKLRFARSREHRESLAELISKEEQKLMFASKGKYFTAEPFIKPTISLHPIAPKSKIILLLSLILGLFTGIGIVLLRNAVSRDKK